MINSLGVIIGFVWGLLSLNLKVDNFTFTIWQLFLFFIVLAFIFNLVFRKKESED